MQIILYRNFSKRQNSTLQPSGGIVKDVVMKRECSTLSPTFLINDVDPAVNYVRWNDRYYFVSEIVLQNNNIYEVRCEIDVLASWKNYIGFSSQYVLRSAAASDGNVIDMFYPSKKDPLVINTDPTISPTFAGQLDSGWYIVGVIGGSSSSGISQGVVQYYVFTSSAFNSFTQAVFTESNWLNFQSSDRYTFNPIQYISSVKWFPVEPPIGAAVSSIMLGWQAIPAICYPLALASGLYQYQFTVSKHPQAASRGNYLNSSPYSQYFVSIPPFGDFNLDPDIVSKLYENRLYGSLKIDFVTGKAMLRLRGQMNDVSHDYEFERRSIQFGVAIQISQIAADRIGVASGAVNTIGGIIGSALSGNLLGAVTGAVSGIASAYQTAQPKVASAGMNDSLIGVMGALTGATLYHVFYYVVDEDNAAYGRPLCQTRTIGSLAGYILCANAEIAIPGLPAERDQIIAYMNGGFFYE